ncbi:hypothetical protein SCHIN_v1c03650 [Spiroplasma chinense]|uniref:Uncharacterized protein n=1 Tax=Spiroplasma chinense TaxID=216932 RepID=A0A5B9Y680_9MOLU|nr:hypothetical protein [Spiroplasma chinense]QEH61562.1 hypothetical protein SCHIN_v1c03650 [Spiroplasma chinense]
MAKLDEKGIIEFTEEDIETAWNNSPELVNKEAQEFRMCFICKFHMKRKEFNNLELGKFGWIPEPINIKNFSFESANFVAIHPGCSEFRPKDDCTKILNKVKKMLWAFDESIYENEK